MGKLNKNIVKMFYSDDPDFEEKNMMIFEGTPEERWRAIRDINRTVGNLHNKTEVSDSLLRRDVVRLYTWNDGKEPLEVE